MKNRPYTRRELRFLRAFAWTIRAAVVATVLAIWLYDPDLDDKIVCTAMFAALLVGFEVAHAKLLQQKRLQRDSSSG
jgi:hypothetical protein